MALSVTHTLQTAIADDPSFDVSSSEWNAAHSMTGTLTISNGGTDIASYAVGDLLYASAATTLAKLPDVATGNALISGGVGAAPAWGKVGLTTHISGTLAVGSGGTNITTYAIGDLLYASGTGALSKLADVATGSVLISGGVNLAPAWGKVGLTTHISGTLPIGNGGTNATDAVTALTNLGAVAKAGDTMTGDLTISKASAALNLKATGDTQALINYFTNGLQRWLSIAQITSGDYLLGRFNDSGVFLDVPFYIGRADGRVYLLGDPTSALGAATKQYVDNKVAAADAASEITFTPAGNIAATNVQAAIAELDTEKASIAAVTAATAAEFVANSAPTELLTPGAVWTAAAPVALTETASAVTPNLSSGIDFTWTLGGAARTINNPSNLKPGQKGVFVLTVGAAGTITTWGTAYKFPGGAKPTLTLNGIDIISYVAQGTSGAPIMYCTHSAGFA